MFSSFVDSKILCSFNVSSEAIGHFDSRIDELRKHTLDEVIKSPPGTECEFRCESSVYDSIDVSTYYTIDTVQNSLLIESLSNKIYNFFGTYIPFNKRCLQ